MNSFKIVIAVIAAAVFFAGCNNNPDLKPAKNANKVKGISNTAVSTVEGVQVSAESGAWDGVPEIKEKVTPLHIVIVNKSGKPLKISYNEFSITDSSGKRYSALPPYEITGTVENPEIVQKYNPLGAPTFDYRGFKVAPYYSHIYPKLPVYGGEYYYDPYYYRYYSGYWKDLNLPTAGMLDRVLPDGVLDDNGRLSGFLYFEKVNTSKKFVTFRADLVNAENGHDFGTITIPFKVE